MRCCFGDPPGCIRAKLHPPDSRVVPKESVASAGKVKGNDHFGITLNELNDATLLIQPAMLVLSQSIDMFIIIGFETTIDME
ncbi:MAG TPA: hypothetical protein VII93_11440 [Anaerolineales bacterium]